MFSSNISHHRIHSEPFSSSLDSTNMRISPLRSRSFLASHIITLIPKRSENHLIQQTWTSLLQILTPYQHLTSLHRSATILIITRCNKRRDLLSTSSLSSNISTNALILKLPQDTRFNTVEISSPNPHSLPTSSIIALILEPTQYHSIQQK